MTKIYTQKSLVISIKRNFTLLTWVSLKFSQLHCLQGPLLLYKNSNSLLNFLLMLK